MEMLLATKGQKKQADTDRLKREPKATDERIGDLSKILTRLYEDMALERISEERYQAMAPGYEREQALLRTRREELSREIEGSEEMYESIEKFLPVI